MWPGLAVKRQKTDDFRSRPSFVPSVEVNPTLNVVGRQLVPSIILVAILVILFIAKYILKREVRASELHRGTTFKERSGSLSILLYVTQ